MIEGTAISIINHLTLAIPHVGESVSDCADATLSASIRLTISARRCSYTD